MVKKLEDMSLEELWELFPISLVAHDPTWALSYERMEERLKRALSGFPVMRISHIGSTAIPDIKAKSIVDVLVELPKDASMAEAVHALEDDGFICMHAEESRASLNLGYTEKGFADEVFHVHLRYAGDNDELYFRDCLLEHPALAREYEALKLGLAKRFEHDRDGYTDAKSDFVRTWTEIAKVEYAGRYES